MVPILMAVQKKTQVTKATSGFRTSVTKMLQRERSRGILLGCCGITNPMKQCIYELSIAGCAGSAACLWAAGLLRPGSTSATGRTARGQRHRQKSWSGRSARWDIPQRPDRPPKAGFLRQAENLRRHPPSISRTPTRPQFCSCSAQPGKQQRPKWGEAFALIQRWHEGRGAERRTSTLRHPH